MGKKGVSAEEKRRRMVEWFHENKSFHNLKDLTKSIAKEKGITSMAIEPILKELIDDSLVDQEKVGSGNYYWSYPAKAELQLKRKHGEAEKSVAEWTAKKQKVEKEIQAATAGREETDERAAVIESLAAEKQREATLAADLAKYTDCDPTVLAAKVEKAKIAKEAANRWTDNMYCAKSWCKAKFGGSFDEKNFDRQFGVPAGFDYLE